MKRLIHVLLSSAMLAWLITPAVHAEPDYTDTEYWQAKCSTVYYDIETQTACRAYNDYMVKNNADIARKYAEIQDELAATGSDSPSRGELLEKLQAEYRIARTELLAIQAALDKEYENSQTERAELEMNDTPLMSEIDSSASRRETETATALNQSQSAENPEIKYQLDTCQRELEDYRTRLQDTETQLAETQTRLDELQEGVQAQIDEQARTTAQIKTMWPFVFLAGILVGVISALLVMNMIMRKKR